MIYNLHNMIMNRWNINKFGSRVLPYAPRLHHHLYFCWLRIWLFIDILGVTKNVCHKFQLSKLKKLKLTWYRNEILLHVLVCTYFIYLYFNTVFLLSKKNYQKMIFLSVMAMLIFNLPIFKKINNDGTS